MFLSTAPPRCGLSLTERERDVLRLMAEGRSNAGIGQKWHLSAKTVERNVANVFTKLGLYATPTTTAACSQC